MLVMEALQWANDKLKGCVDSPMFDAEILLASVLDCNKSWLFTHLDFELKTDQEEKFHEFIKRRTKKEPVAYIVGWKEFYKRRFTVNRFTLIPRPATETLVEQALLHLNDSPTIFADIGTGSGAIAITLAAESGLPVLATDMSRQALTVAKTNTTTHHVEELVDFRHGNLADPVIQIFASLIKNGTNPFQHLIICANLPYLTERQVETGQTDVRDFEPHDALIAGHDGLDAYWNLFRQLKQYRSVLPEHVTVLIEIDPSQNRSIIDLITHDFPQANPSIINDLDGFARVVISEI